MAIKSSKKSKAKDEDKKKAKAKAKPEKEVKKSKKEKDVKAKKSSKVEKEVKGKKKVKAGKEAKPAKGKKKKSGLVIDLPKAVSKEKAKKMLSAQAPDEFKPHFLEVFVRSGRDGLLDGNIKAIRYQGKYDPNAEDKKKFDLSAYDQPTLQAILARLSAKTFATNAAKRLIPRANYRLLIRVSKRSADNTLIAGVKEVSIQHAKATGRETYVLLDKADATCRKFRGAGRFLPLAFVNVQAPPKKVKGKVVRSNDDDE